MDKNKKLNKSSSIANFTIEDGPFSFLYSLLIVIFLILTAILKLCVVLINSKKYSVVDEIEEIPIK